LGRRRARAAELALGRARASGAPICGEWRSSPSGGPCAGGALACGERRTSPSGESRAGGAAACSERQFSPSGEARAGGGGLCPLLPAIREAKTSMPRFLFQVEPPQPRRASPPLTPARSCCWPAPRRRPWPPPQPDQRTASLRCSPTAGGHLGRFAWPSSSWGCRPRWQLPPYPLPAAVTSGAVGPGFTGMSRVPRN